MWSGNIASVPSGWALCNGANGTPNLQNRFIVGAGDSYSIGAIGGEATHILTVNEMPSHNHSFSAYDGADSPGGVGYIMSSSNRTSSGWVSFPDTRVIIGNTGNGNPHENRPPYYALAFIMKL